jgi:5-methylcytosine-specific restriction endonuclease McrA
MDVTPDWKADTLERAGARRKKYRRKVASPKRWAAILDAKVSECRACGGREQLDAHHIVRKGSPFFGDDTESNVIGLCRACHDDFHRGDKKVRKILRYRFTDEETAYATQRGGETYLDERYWDPFKDRSQA